MSVDLILNFPEFLDTYTLIDPPWVPIFSTLNKTKSNFFNQLDFDDIVTNAYLMNEDGKDVTESCMFFVREIQQMLDEAAT